MSSSSHKAQRTCLGCRQVQDQGQLVRYVVSPQGEVLTDYRHKLPGRGAYTCIDRACVELAVRRQQFGRAFKGQAPKPAVEELLQSLVVQIRERIVSLLGMARKSGNVVTGGSLVLSALAVPGQLALVLLAEDISEGVAAKVKGKAESKRVPCFNLLDKGILGQVMGKGERSVVALKSGPLAESLLVELIRYKRSVGES